MRTDQPFRSHLEAGDVAAYLDLKLSADDRSRVEVHLAECAECRRELVEVRRVLGNLPRFRRWHLLVPAAAAAAALFVILGPPERDRRPAPVGRERGPRGTERAALIAVVEPGVGAAVAPGPVVFTWRGVGTGATYRLTVTDERGDVVWSANTADTMATLPARIGLERGRRYAWYLDALLPDGRSVTSGVRAFVVAR